MREFIDNAGRRWELAVNLASAKRVRDVLRIDLLSIDALDKLADLVTLGDVLYVLCRPQAEARGVSDEGFGGALAGDAIDAASRALLEEMADFFPQRSQRDALRKLLECSLSVATAIGDQAKMAADALTPERLAGILGGTPTTSPAPSASTPAP